MDLGGRHHTFLQYYQSHFIFIDFLLKIEYNTNREIPTFPTYKNGGVVMTTNTFIDNAKVMAKGQITIPKDIRVQLGVDVGDKVTLICEGNQVIMMNAAVYAMQMLQKGMLGEGKKHGLQSEEDINSLVKEVREHGQ